jgi:class 3 adenylate cyclase
VWRAQIDELHFRWRSEALQAWVEGSVGWVADRPTFVLPDGQELPLRLTAVFHLERGHWKMVQYHLSIATANEAALGKPLTTSLESLSRSVQTERPDLGGVAAPNGTVTVIFTDIEGSSEMAERMGDVRWMDLLHWHDAVLRSGAERCGGFVVKSQGDGFMLAFSSAADALDFAVSAQFALAPGFEGETVRIRIGVNSGEAIRAGSDFYGRTVILAARVAAQARGGEILVSELVTGLVAGLDRYRFGPPRVVELKGLSGRHYLFPLLDDAGRLSAQADIAPR